MTPMNASTLAGSVLRYGNPVFDCDGAWIRAASRLLEVVGEACEKAGVEWAMVAGGGLDQLLGNTAPVVDSVPEALDQFAEANMRRRSMMMPLLAAKLTKSA